MFHIVDQEELTFPFTETARFDDPETGERITVTPSAIREEYLDTVQAFMESIRTGCAKIQVDYERMETEKTAGFRAVLLSEPAHGETMMPVPGDTMMSAPILG